MQTSIALAGGVITQLKLDQDSEFTPPDERAPASNSFNPLSWFSGGGPILSESEGSRRAEASRGARIVQKFLSRLSVVPIGLSAAMQVTFESQNPQKAQKIANAIANAYVEDQLIEKLDVTRKTTQWLAGRVSELSVNAQDADTAVQRYKGQRNITSTAGGIGRLASR